jgi:2-polyprenyl-3-methyl-5-hydroxy-6-metoxy-1,4-benzoquinol methylase
VDQRPDRPNEKKRYLLHQNHLQDQGYRAFAAPILDRVRTGFDHSASGLDFGCGHNPVISEILRNENFKVDDYDPLFYPDRIFEDRTYDFIVCCEVIEHFHHPDREFVLLSSLLKESGSLICMTDIYSDETDFSTWYYKNDPTHVFIYRHQTFEYICSKNDFNRVAIEGRLIEFFK